MSFENKLAAIINKDIEFGVALNAIAHASVGLGNQIEKSLLRLDDYQDQEGNIYPNISQIPFIILRGKSGEIRKAIKAAREAEIQYGIFTNTMTGETYKEQLQNTLQTSEEQLIYYATVLFGPWDIVTQITKKFSLYK